MIDGITILSQESIGVINSLSVKIFLLGVLILIIWKSMHFAEIKNSNIMFVIGIIIIIFSAISSKILPEEETGRYRYKCIIDDSISFNYIVDNYYIVGQDGNHWILEDIE